LPASGKRIAYSSLLWNRTLFCGTRPCGSWPVPQELLADIELPSLTDPRRRAALLLAERQSGQPEAARLVPEFLRDPDPEIRFRPSGSLTKS
jgi:hypothetical protein